MVPRATEPLDETCKTTRFARTSSNFGRSVNGLTAQTKGEARDQVEAALDLLDRGELRVAEPTGSGWVVHEWLKKAVLLSFRLNDLDPDAGDGRAGL